MKSFKKSALFLALAAAAFGAQAVDVYGTADVGYVYSDFAGVDSHGLASNGKTDSYIGIRTAEDLGNGLKLGVTLEAGYNLDDGTTATGNLFNREASIGFFSGAHAVKFGRLPTFAYDNVRKFDAFGGNNLGIARGISNVAEYDNNAFSYTFSHSGVTAGVQHSFGEQPDGGWTQGSITALNVGYANGPFSAAVSHTDVDAGARTVQVGAAYDFGVAKASLLVQDAKDSALDRSFVLGVKAPLDRFSVSASVGQAKLFNGDKVDLYAVGGDYSLSKRTSLYAAYGHIDATGANGNQLGLGISHKF